MAKEAKKFSDPSYTRISTIQGELESTRGVLLENIEKLMERERFLSELEDSTASLAMDADVFRQKSKTMASTFWWQNMKLRLAIAGAIIFVLFIIVWIGCGATFQRCAPPPSPPAVSSLPSPAPEPFVIPTPAHQ